MRNRKVENWLNKNTIFNVVEYHDKISKKEAIKFVNEIKKIMRQKQK